MGNFEVWKTRRKMLIKIFSLLKVLGGTSVMNGMTYMRGSRKDYDDWARMGNPGWSYQEVLPYFLRSEDNGQINHMDYGYHATGGPLTVTQFPYHPPLSRSLIEAGRELGNCIINSSTGFFLVNDTKGSPFFQATTTSTSTVERTPAS